MWRYCCFHPNIYTSYRVLWVVQPTCILFVVRSPVSVFRTHRQHSRIQFSTCPMCVNEADLCCVCMCLCATRLYPFLHLCVHSLRSISFCFACARVHLHVYMYVSYPCYVCVSLHNIVICGGTISQRLPVVQSGLNLSIVNTSTVSTAFTAVVHSLWELCGNFGGTPNSVPCALYILSRAFVE